VSADAHSWKAQHTQAYFLFLLFFSCMPQAGRQPFSDQMWTAGRTLYNQWHRCKGEAWAIRQKIVTETFKIGG